MDWAALPIIVEHNISIYVEMSWAVTIGRKVGDRNISEREI